MEEVVSRRMCTGCTACESVCPSQAITMEAGYEGFKYPEINQEKCIDCGLCKRKCPILNREKNESLNNCYVGYNKNDGALLNKASSGSIFELVATYVLEKNGVVIGAALDEKKILRHVAIEKGIDLLPLKGSKYLQSDLGDILSYAKEMVQSKLVLFVGTPCQVAGIRSVISGENLICIDVICHGVPTPKIFEKYLQELEKKYKDNIVDYNFRDKATGWDTYSNTAIFKNKKVSELHINNSYMKLFLSDLALRESCYNCKFKLGNKYSDITLGDFWGVKNYYPDMYNKKGVSAIIVNTDKGQKIFDIIKENICYKRCNIEEIIAGNKSLVIFANRPKKRAKFFEDLDNMEFNKLVNKYVPKPSLKRRIKNIIKKIIKV